MVSNIPWVEKYRPRVLSDIYGQDKNIENIQSIIGEDMPHIILEGPAGTGKTSTAIAIARELYRGHPKGVFKHCVKELNASDARGINVIRTEVKDTAKSKPPDNVPFKLIILDEADNMTNPAQTALRRTMEKHSNNCKFILICNYRNKIISPIQSRCVVFHYRPLSKEELKRRLIYIAKSEDVEITGDGLDVITYVARGDLRKSINILQGASMISDMITEDDIYLVTGSVDRKKVQEVIASSIEGDLVKALDDTEKMLEFGSSGKELAIQIFLESAESDISNEDKMLISGIVSDAIFRINLGCSEKVQLRGLVAGIYRGAVEL